jgi:type IV secretion system protein VirD4
MQALGILLPVIAAALVLWYIGGPKNFPAAMAAFFHRLRIGFSLLFILFAAFLSFGLLVVGGTAFVLGWFSAAISAWSIMVMLFVAAAALMKTRSDIRRSNLFGDAHFCSEAETAVLDLFGNSGIPIGSFLKIEPDQEPVERPLFYAGDRHLITVSPSRGGKGTTAIIPALLSAACGSSAVIIDPKGQNAAVTARRRRDGLSHKVILLNPFKLHAELFEAAGFPATHQFNPLAGFDSDSENFVADVTSLAEALIISSGHDPHWGDSARDLITALMMYVCVDPDETKTLPRVRQLLTQPISGKPQSDEDGKPADAAPPPPGTLAYTLAQVAACGFAPAEQRASRFLGALGREFQSILSTALTQTAFLDDPAIAYSLGGDDFRFVDLKREPVTVYLILPSRYIAAYARWLRLMVVSAINDLTSTADKPPKPVLLILDEFAQLGHLSSIETAMALAAGFSLKIWPILQDINQAKEIYKDRWETFFANAGIIQVFRPNDMTSAEHFSKRAGTWTDYSETHGTSEGGSGQGGSWGRSHSRTPHSKNLLSPMDLIGLPEALEVLFVAGSQYPVRATRHPYYSDRRYAGQFDLDPFHAPAPAAPAPVVVPLPVAAPVAVPAQ